MRPDGRDVRLSVSALRLGAHMSIAGGLHTALERGAAAGCAVVQLFTKANRNWSPPRPLVEEELAAWFATRERTGVEPAMAHDSYLINVGSPKAADWNKSFAALAEEYERCGLLQIPYLVMHPGAHLGSGESAAIARIATAIDRLHQEQPQNATVVLLENTAGQGTNVGYRFEHLRDLLGAIEDPARAGVCIDTCHTYAGDYDLTTAAGWEETFRTFDELVGVEAIRAFHVNDSKKPLGSRVDRHEHLGRGQMGLTPFRCLVSDERFVGLPMALETPKSTSSADSINLEILRALAGRSRLTARAKRLAGQDLELEPVS